MIESVASCSSNISYDDFQWLNNLTHYPIFIFSFSFPADERSANQLQNRINSFTNSSSVCEFTLCGKALYGDYQTINTASKPVTKADYNHRRSACIRTW